MADREPTTAAYVPLPAPPVCVNCRRAVYETCRMAVLVDGELVSERVVCSACKVYVLDCAIEPAPWLQSAAVTR